MNNRNRSDRKTVSAITLGCKVNSYDTEAMMELFEDAGYNIVDFGDQSDVYIINTCTVTNVGDRKSRQMIRKAKRQNQDAVIAVAGCYAQTSPEELKQIPEVNIIVGNKDRNKIVDLVENLQRSGSNIDIVQDIMNIKEYEELKISKVRDRSRAFIKVQEGCSNFCTYCIIPFARGPVRSRSLENVIEEGKKIAQQGYKEVVITGINVTSYGRELDGVSLIDLLRGLNNIEGIERIRLGSLEPMLIDKEFIEGLKSVHKLCDHFHLSLQSGSDRILKVMNRKYDTKMYREIIEDLRKVYPLASFTTDIMVGFPGETDDDFEESYDFIESIKMNKLHVFKYSKRQGTPAAKMKNQIDERVKEERSKRIIDLSNKLEIEYQKQFLGKKLEVLFEQKVKEDYNIYQGHTKNYLLVQTKSTNDITDEIHSVELQELKDTYIIGSLEE